MLNQVVLVGRLTADPQAENYDNGKKYSHITLAIPRSLKNAEGIYDTDFIKCTLWNAIADSTAEYCHKGDIVGIRGRLQNNSYKDQEGNMKYTLDVIADKVSFLSSKPAEFENEEESK